MLERGEGSRSCRVGMAASAGFGIVFSPSLPATLLARVSSMLRRCETIRSRNDRRLDLAEFEGQSGGDVCLLADGLADEELTSLTIMIREAFRAQTAFRALLDVGKRREAALRRLRVALRRRNSAGS